MLPLWLFTLKPRGGTMQNENMYMILKIVKSTLQNEENLHFFTK